MIWAFMSAIVMTTKAYRYDDFTFVANRLSSSLANGLFLITASLVGGITAMLSGNVLKIIVFAMNEQVVSSSVEPQEWLLGFVAACIYMLLFAALGYLVGLLTQLHKVFVFILPVLLFGALFIGIESVAAAVQFVFMESSFFPICY